MPTAALNMLRVDRLHREPLQAQLYGQIRRFVISGELAAGTRLPSTRELMGQLRLSRNTIVYAFERLVTEGYLESKPGSGTYVAPVHGGMHGRDTGDVRSRTRSYGQRRLSARAAVLAGARISPEYSSALLRPFRPCQPAVDVFSLRTWNRARSSALRSASEHLLFLNDPAGLPRLRQTLCVYLRDARGVRCEPDQIIVTSGSQQALTLLASTLIDPGDAIWIEDPGYLGARAAFSAAGAKLVPIVTDEYGLAIPHATNPPSPRLIYTTPSRQFPLGTTMSLARRLALLEFARSAGAWIVEDDYDSEFRYVGRPLPSLQGMDSSGDCVIYVGSLNKVLFGSLRLGYLVVPEHLANALRTAKEVDDGACPAVDQATVAVLIEEGSFATHVRRMRALYAERRDAFLREARRRLSGLVTFPDVEAGMDAIGWLASATDDTAVSRRLGANGVDAPPLSAYSMRPCEPGLLFGFTAFTLPQTLAALEATERSLR